MPIRTCITDPPRMPLRLAVRLACGGGAGSGQISADPDSPTLVELPANANVVDFLLTGGDVFMQFGDEDIDDNFVPALAMYYPLTDGFGVEPVGVPVGATHVAMMLALGGSSARLVQQQAASLATFAGYGGAVESFKCSVTGSTFGATMAAPVTNAPVFMAARVRSSNVGAASTTANHFFALVPATNINTGVFALRKNSNAASNTWGAHYKASSANTDSANVLTADEDAWTTIYGWFTLTTEVDVQIGSFDETNFDRISAVTTGSFAYAGPQTRVVVGGIVNATGQGFMLADDEFCMGIACTGATMPTHLQAQELSAEDCSLWSNIVDGWGISLTMATWVGVDRDGNLRDFVSGNILTELTGFTAGTFAAAAYTGPHLRQPNRIRTQDANAVLKIPYSNVASGDIQAPANPSCRWRYHAHHDLRLAIGTAPNPAVSFITLPDGVGLTYGRGSAIDFDVINDSGAAGDTGVGDLVGLDEVMDLYDPAQSGLAYTVTGGVLDLGGTTNGYITGNVTRAWGMYKPNSGANGIVVVIAVGAGGQAGGSTTYTEGAADSEYGDLAQSLARCGYTVIILSFADEGQSATVPGPTPFPAFDYPERISEYRTFLEDHVETISGLTAPDVIIAGHSGGGLTAQGSTHITWIDETAAPVSVNQALPVLEGGGSILGCLAISTQGDQDDQKNATLELTAWSTVTVPTFYFTGTADSDGGTGDPLWRFKGYENGPASLPSLKMRGLNWTHLYGGSLSTNTIDNSSDKRRTKVIYELFQNMVVCACDHWQGVEEATERLRAGWDDRQVDTYETRNI